MFVKISEQPSLYNDLEKKSVREILEDINREDQKVALAVQKAIPQIEKLVTQIVPRMKQGGRIFYMGAGTSGRLGVLDASEIPPTFGMPPTLVHTLCFGGVFIAVSERIIKLCHKLFYKILRIDHYFRVAKEHIQRKAKRKRRQ